MFNGESEREAQSLERPGGPDRVIRLDASQTKRLAHILSRAFQEEPHFIDALPDEEERCAALPWLVSSAIHTSHLEGENYTTADIDGGALWIAPGRTSTLEQILRAGVRSLPFKLRHESLARCIRLGARLAWVRQELAKTPHWYLIALAMDPSKRRNCILGDLMQPVLARADSDRLPCYLETFQEPNL